MNYFPCNDIAISVNGVPHRGKLKLRNEYVPIVSPASIFMPESSNYSYYMRPSYALTFREYLLLASYRAENHPINTSGFVLEIVDGFWKNTNKMIFPRCKISDYTIQMNYCYIGDFIYYYIPSSNYVTIYRLNSDLTYTVVATTPQHTVYTTGMGHFKNDNGEDCLLIYDSYIAGNQYYYNLVTKTWTQFTCANMPTSYPRNMYYTDTPNTVLWEFQAQSTPYNGSIMYEYNVLTNTFTNVSAWGEQGRDIGRVNKTYFKLPIKCKVQTYFVVWCNVDTHYQNSTWITKDVFCVLDENGSVIATLDNIKPISAFPYKECIGFMTLVNDNLGSSGSMDNRVGAKFYRFDPETKTLYDMSIPHLVIDE